MAKPLRVLIIQDSGENQERLLGMLKEGGFDPSSTCVETKDSLVAELKESLWDVVLSDYYMPQIDGMEALKIVRDLAGDIPFIFVSGTIGESLAVAAIRGGAQDYISKGNLKRLLPAVEYELAQYAIRKERHKADETILHMAYYDFLTDLPNRTFFMDLLQRAIVVARRHKEKFSVLVVDPNHLGGINDALGHAFGDEVLHQVGLRLRNLLRESDTLSRVEGDVFAVLLEGAGEEGAARATERIFSMFETPFTVEGVPVVLNVVIGIAVFPDHKDSPEMLIEGATGAAHSAKANGKDFAVYSADQDYHAALHVRLMGQMREAIENEQMLLFYQPQINLKTGGIAGMEGLVRWQHKEHGLLQPADFIPAAEQSGMIKLVSGWNLETGLKQLKQWDAMSFSSSMALNLSARSLQDRFFIRHVERLLQENGIAPDRLGFEITETAIITNQTKAKAMLTEFSCLGITIAIDGFGAGFTSIALLKKFPINGIKLDMTLVWEILREKRDMMTVRSLITMAHDLGLWVVAEGVEDEETRALLEALDCDFGQGYFLGRPLPAEEMTRLLEKRKRIE